MEAHVGDHLVVEGAKVGQPPRRGEVLEILQGVGGPRLRVRWDDSAHETVLAPGPDTRIEAGDAPPLERATHARGRERGRGLRPLRGRGPPARPGPRVLRLGAGPPPSGRPRDAGRGRGAGRGPCPGRRLAPARRGRGRFARIGARPIGGAPRLSADPGSRSPGRAPSPDRQPHPRGAVGMAGRPPHRPRAGVPRPCGSRPDWSR